MLQPNVRNSILQAHNILSVFGDKGKENQVQQLCPDEPQIFCTKGITKKKYIYHQAPKQKSRQLKGTRKKKKTLCRMHYTYISLNTSI
jgi:hypothetical protein